MPKLAQAFKTNNKSPSHFWGAIWCLLRPPEEPGTEMGMITPGLDQSGPALWPWEVYDIVAPKWVFG